MELVVVLCITYVCTTIISSYSYYKLHETKESKYEISTVGLQLLNLNVKDCMYTVTETNKTQH